MNPVVHEDQARVSAFYEKAFGWQTQALGAEMSDYVLAMTTETEGGRPKAPGAINGGFFPKKADMPAPHPSVVVSVDNIGDSIEKVERSGGTVLGEPMDIPGVGKYVSFMDTEGNRVGMLEPLRGAM